MSILPRLVAASILAEQIEKQQTPKSRQGYLDFMNDLNYESDWKEPPSWFELDFKAADRLHYVEVDEHGEIILHAVTCNRVKAEALIRKDAGVGKASVRAQIYRAMIRRRENEVETE